MLILIGLGMETGDISVRALDAVKAADKVYLEQYTTRLPLSYPEYLKEETGKEITEIGRSELEEGSKTIIDSAVEKNVAILVPGDPLIATTHHATLLDIAHRAGIKTAIYHATSIYSAAIGESGLDVYRFGPTITIPFWFENYKPSSFLEGIRKNLLNDQHTLLLLDINQKEKRTMNLEEAIAALRAAESDKMLGIVSDDLRIMVLGDIGRETQDIAYIAIGSAENASRRFANMTLSLIIPATPNFAEEESVKKFSA